MSRTKSLSLTPGLLVLASLLLTPIAGAAPSQDGTWLDEEADWSTPGAAIPQAPAQDGSNLDNCEQTVREASLFEDALVDTTLITGMADADGMCRPFQYQVFVFTDGEFSGTLSPLVMDSRTDGSLVDFDLYREGMIDATFNRYQPGDAQCCASRESRIFYAVENTENGPVLVPQLPASTYDRDLPE